MSRKRRSFGASLKAKAALAAVRGDKTTAQLAAKFGVHANQISSLKLHLLEGAAELFADRRGKGNRDRLADEQELYEQIGRLKMEVEWLKKKLPNSAEERRRWIDPGHSCLSVTRQCELLDLSRSTCYYRPLGESLENLALMRRIDELYLKRPFYGSRKMAETLGANRKRISRLMRLMGIEAIYPKRRTTRPAAGHTIYPYLLPDVTITRVDHVWSTDITYIPMRHGFLYLAAVMDWYSRYVLSWRLSNTMDGAFCLEVLDEALAGGRPEIFNTDQGSQFTSDAFTGRLKQYDIAISMDGRGRAIEGRIHRAAVAKCEVRRGLPQGLRRRLGGGRFVGELLRLLLPRADSSSTRLPHASRGVRPPETKNAKSSALKFLLRQASNRKT